MTETFVVVGGGQAAAWAVSGMRKAGFSGSIVLVGDEPYLPYERPPLSKETLLCDEPKLPAVHPEEFYRDNDVTLLLGDGVEKIDPVKKLVVLQTGQTLAYEKLLLATGGRARRIQVSDDVEVLYLRNFDDALRLRTSLDQYRHVTCIGAGIIGLELASSARKRDIDVAVVDTASKPMERCLTDDLCGYMENLHRSSGVAFHFNASVTAMNRRSDGRYAIECSNGEAWITDCIVAGIGMERNLELAKAAGLNVRRGVIVDEFGKTSDPFIYAAGDVAEFWHPSYGRHLCLEAWRHAQNHGESTGRSMAGSTTAYNDVPWIWTDQHGVNIQVGGVIEQPYDIVRRGSETSFIDFHVREGIVVSYVAVNNPRDARIGLNIIRDRLMIAALRLCDTSVPLQKIAREAAIEKAA